MIHTVDKPYQCCHSYKTFSQNSYVMEYFRKYTGKKPYQWSQCDKDFSQNTSLKNHLMIHTVENPINVVILRMIPCVIVNIVLI